MYKNNNGVVYYFVVTAKFGFLMKKVHIQLKLFVQPKIYIEKNNKNFRTCLLSCGYLVLYKSLF